MRLELVLRFSIKWDVVTSVHDKAWWVEVIRVSWCNLHKKCCRWVRLGEEWKISDLSTESNESNVESHVANTSKITFIHALIWLHYCSNKICVCMKRFVCLCVMEDFYMWHAHKPFVCMWICVCANRPVCQYLKPCVCHRIMFLFVYSKNLQMCIQIYMSTVKVHEIVSLRYTKVLTYNWIRRGFVSLSIGSFFNVWPSLHSLCERSVTLQVICNLKELCAYAPLGGGCAHPSIHRFSITVYPALGVAGRWSLSRLS